MRRSPIAAHLQLSLRAACAMLSNEVEPKGPRMDVDKAQESAIDKDTDGEQATPEEQTPEEQARAERVAAAAERALAEAHERKAADAAKADGPGEIGGPSGPDPTRFGDWEKKGLAIDF